MKARAAVASLGGAEVYELPVSGTLRLAHWSTLVAGMSAFASAVLGVRYGQSWLYQSDGLMAGQVYGQDHLVLVVALPLLVGAVGAARSGSVRGLFGWGGVLVYLAYWYHFVLGGIAFGPAFLLHLTVVASSLFALGVLGARLDVERIAHRFRHAMPARAIGGLMLLGGTLFAAAGMLDMGRQLHDRALIDAATRAVYSIDFTIMLPATILAGVLLWHRKSWGYVLAGPLLINAALSAMTILFAMVTLTREGAPFGPATVVFASASVVMIVAVITYMRGLRVST
jgi:hypothetical protein